MSVSTVWGGTNVGFWSISCEMLAGLMRPPRAKRAYLSTASATWISVSAAASGVSAPVAGDGTSKAAAGRPQFSARLISPTTALPLSVRPLVETQTGVPVIVP